MDTSRIRQIIEDAAFPDTAGDVQLFETHISWVILSDRFAFKIKKPMRYSFLNFSTLSRRKFFCEEELRLNRRLTEEVYLAVLPVREQNDRYGIGSAGKGRICDYAVQMKRLDNRMRMDTLLAGNDIQADRLEALALQLARFHQHAEPSKAPITHRLLFADFADITKVIDKNALTPANTFENTVEKAVDFAKSFLSRHLKRLKARKKEGFFVDGHGDLHCRNIFLYDTPVVFDCIEFNARLRQIDVLSEIAFLCMDLEVNRRADLSEAFLQKYLAHFDIMPAEEDYRIFQYFKLYRANVRFKVYSLKAMQGEKQPAEVYRYAELMKTYLTNLSD